MWNLLKLALSLVENKSNEQSVYFGPKFNFYFFPDHCTLKFFEVKVIQQ